MLTRKQHELLLFINSHLQAHGISPSFDEMKEALGLRSKSGIHRLITGLEERGFLKRLPHRARALEVIRLPEEVGVPMPPRETPVSGRFAPNVIQGNFRGLAGAVPVGTAAETVQLPLYGKIAAGTPIEALRDHSRTLDLPASMLGRGEHFALEVEGDSMIEAGIYDGDTILVERCDTAENGAVVVALIDDTEVTLKRLRRKGASIALEPSNPSYETRIFGPDRVKVQGRLIGLYRRY